jgi:hypothetical protein
MTRPHASLHSILRILANEYPGEVASLTMLDPEEAGLILSQVLKETPGAGAVEQPKIEARLPPVGQGLPFTRQERLRYRWP